MAPPSRRTPSAVDVRIYVDSRAGERRARRRARAIATGGGAAVVSLVSLLLVLIATGHAPGSRREPAPAREVRLIRMTLVDGALDPSVVLLEPGDVRFAVANNGDATRRFVIDGPGTHAQTDDLAPGSSASLDVSLARAGRYRLQAVAPSGGVLAAGTLDVRR